MPWRTSLEDLVREAAAELTPLFGDALRTVVLYGSAARPGVRRARADVNLAVVADPLAFAHLQRVAQWWARWRRYRLAAPLLLSATELDRARDVFPLELLDIQAHHRTLAGAELFADVPIAAACVRAECEREARGKLVRLRELYLELAGSTRALRALMLDSRTTFLVVMRGLLHLRGAPWDPDGRAVVAAVERHYGCRLPALAAVEAAPPGTPVEQRFADYLADVETLVALADRAPGAAG
jgi:hypothetical protein